MRIALASLAVAGCFYYPGSYSFQTQRFVGKRVALPCLDLAVAMTDDEQATAPVVRYSFGNRCTHTTVVDLGAVPAFGIDASGERVALHAYDPRHELRPLPIDGWWRGSENIMYTSDNGVGAGRPWPSTICIDAAAAEPQPAHRESWVCVGAVKL